MLPFFSIFNIFNEAKTPSKTIPARAAKIKKIPNKNITKLSLIWYLTY